MKDKLTDKEIVVVVAALSYFKDRFYMGLPVAQEKVNEIIKKIDRPIERKKSWGDKLFNGFVLCVFFIPMGYIVTTVAEWILF